MDKYFVTVSLADGMTLVGLITAKEHPDIRSMAAGIQVEDPRAIRVIPSQGDGYRVVLTQLFPTPSSQRQVFVVPISIEVLGAVVNDVFSAGDQPLEVKEFYDTYQQSLREWSNKISRIAQPSSDEARAVLNKNINLKLV